MVRGVTTSVRWAAILLCVGVGRQGSAETASVPVTYRAKTRVVSLGRLALSSDSLSPNERELYDLQYRRRMRYRVVPLLGVTRAAMALLRAKRGAPRKIDGVLLHFSNGTLVPVAANDPLKDVYLALARRQAKKGGWTSRFPVLRRDSAYFADRAPP